MDFDKLAAEMMTLAYGVGISGDQSRELIRVRLEELCRDYACRAAGIMSGDADKIERLVWYRDDGWQHGGSAISWQDRCEELQVRAEAAEACIEEIALAVRDEAGSTSRDIVRTVEQSVKRWETLDL